MGRRKEDGTSDLSCIDTVVMGRAMAEKEETHKDLRLMKSAGVSDNLCPTSFLSMVSGIRDFKLMLQHQFCLWCYLQMGNLQTDSLFCL